MAKLQEMGEFVRSASSTIEAPVVRRLKEAFSAQAGKAQEKRPAGRAAAAAGGQPGGNGQSPATATAPAPAAEPVQPAARREEPGTAPAAPAAPAAASAPAEPATERAAAAPDHPGPAAPPPVPFPTRAAGNRRACGCCRAAASRQAVRPAPGPGRRACGRHRRARGAAPGRPAARSAAWQQPVQLDRDRHGLRAAGPASRPARCASRQRAVRARRPGRPRPDGGQARGARRPPAVSPALRRPSRPWRSHRRCPPGRPAPRRTAAEPEQHAPPASRRTRSGGPGRPRRRPWRPRYRHPARRPRRPRRWRRRLRRRPARWRWRRRRWRAAARHGPGPARRRRPRPQRHPGRVRTARRPSVPRPEVEEAAPSGIRQHAGPVHRRRAGSAW